MQRFQEVLVDKHSFVVTLFTQFQLLFEAFFLVDGVIQLTVCVGQLFTVHHQLEAFGQSGLAAVHLGQRAHFYRIVGDEGRLYECAFTEFAEDFVYQLAFAHGVVNLHFQFAAHLADFFLALAVEVVAGLFLNGIQDGQAAVRSLEADGLSVDGSLCAAVYSDTDTFEEFLGESHHPVVVLILYVQLHAGKFRVVVFVHTFVTEILSDFVYTLKTAYDKSLQVKLGGDTQVEVHIQ